MMFVHQGHKFITVTDPEGCTFWWERQKALHVCDCGAQAYAIPAEVGNPDTTFVIEMVE